MKMAVIMILVCCCLSGCYDKAEPNDIAFVTAVGIDKSKQNKENYDITFQIAKPAQISGGASQEGGQGGEIIQNITVEAPTVYAGIETANFIISKMISLSHIRLFVFSEEIAREGIADITETMTRSEEIRPNVYLAVSKNSAKEYLESVQPSAEINPAKYYQAKFDKEIIGGIPKSTNNKFYFYQKTSEKNAIIPLAAKIKTKEEKGSQGSGQNSSQGQNSGESGPQPSKENELQKDAPMNETQFEYKIKNYVAGQLAISEENESELMGMALFKGDRMVGEMGSTETLIYNILTNNFQYGYVTFASEKTKTPITIMLRRTQKTKVDYDKNKNSAKLKLSLEGEFISLPADYITEKDTNHFEKEIKEAFLESFNTFLMRLQSEFNTDILGIGSYAKASFLTHNDFENFNWEEKFLKTQFEIDVDFKIIRTGLTVRTEKK